MKNDFYPSIPDEKWNDWHWQYENRITTVGQLSEILTLSKKQKDELDKCLEEYKMAITPYYLSLIDKSDNNDPIKLQAIPRIEELKIVDEDQNDPLHEESDSPCVGLTHRYPDRVLFLVTNQCSMYCRHCTRRRFAGQIDKCLTEKQIENAINYIKNHPEIRDVLISGGDPLTLSDEKLDDLLFKLRSIKHIEILRIGTRIPVVMPQRITPKLCNILKKYHPLWINVHFNHPKEITNESQVACSMLIDSGIPLGNQSVLLSGVNDCISIMNDLVHKLVKNRIRPYYIYQCDLSTGISHFRTSVSKGIEIIEGLQGHTTGFAVPTYVIDAPGGGGKIPISPNRIVSQGYREYVLRNFEGKLYSYIEPVGYNPNCNCKNCIDNKNSGLKGVINELK